MWKLNEEGQAEWSVPSVEDLSIADLITGINQVYQKPETEEEKRERMLKAVQAASQS